MTFDRYKRHLPRTRVLSLVLLGASLAACSQASKQAADQAGVQDVTLNVFKADEGVKGPDGRTHDSFVPSGFVVKAGLPVHLSIVNHDDGAHTMTLDSSEAGFGPFMVKPGNAAGPIVKPANSTFDFTPTKKGAFRWHCEVFCDDAANHWAMGHAIVSLANHGGAPGPSSQKAEVGFMAGYIVVR